MQKAAKQNQAKAKLDTKDGKKKEPIRVEVHDFHQVREEEIDISSGKDRRRLEYIINYESHKLKKRDRHELTELIKKFPKMQKEELEKSINPENLN